MNNLVFDRVDSQEKLDKWKKFAASFDHATDTPITPIINVSKREGDRLTQFGFYSVFAQPIIFPSFHPAYCTPRNFADMVSAFSNAACLSSISSQYPNGACHVGLVTGGLPVGRHNVARLGFENLNIEIHRRLP